MKSRITILVTFLLALQCGAQLSTDSLLVELNKHFSKTGTKEYLQKSFTTFENKDRSERYDVFLDSTNQLRDYIDLAIVHFSFDDRKRIKLIEGFNKKGERSYWDFPVVQRFRYVQDTLVTSMNIIRSEICRCKTDALSDAVIIQEIYNEVAYNKTRVFISSKDSTMKLTYAICSNGKVCHRGDGVYFVYREFGGEYRELITHERYFDQKMRLVNGRHRVYTSENVSHSPPHDSYAYSIRELKDGKIGLIQFYNSKGRLVCTANYTLIESGPVNVPE